MLANIIEYQLPIANRAGTIAHRERLDAIDDFSIRDNFTFLRHLEKKDFAFVGASIAIGKVFDEKYAAILIELDFAIDKIRSCDLHRMTAGFLRYHVDHLLRKRVPQERSLAPAATHYGVQRLAPATPILLLFVRPFANQHH